MNKCRKAICKPDKPWCTGTMLAIASLILMGIRGQSAPALQADNPIIHGYRVVNTYPHDSEAYTQGLLYRDGYLFESTGLRGRSELRKVRLESGEVIQRHVVDAKYFAEGLTDWEETLIQLTWQSNTGFVYGLSSFKLRRTFEFSGEGWGLTQDRERLIMSDGTSTLRFLDPVNLREIGRVAVKDGSQSVENLNELEFVQNEIYANVWHSDRIARIDPRSGQVVGWIDLTGLLANSDRKDPEAVLNGIAYDAGKNRLFVTGKLWPKLFEIRVERR